MKFLVLDTETGGLDPTKHSLLSVAMIAYDTNIPHSEENQDHFLIKHDEYTVTGAALVLNCLSVSSIHKYGISTEEAVWRISRFINSNFDSKNDFMILGKNPAFDKSFLKTLFDKHNVSVDDYISHRYLDLSSLVGLAKDLLLYPADRSTGLGAVADFYKVKGSLTPHEALDDCIMTIKLYNHLKASITGSLK